MFSVARPPDGLLLQRPSNVSEERGLRGLLARVGVRGVIVRVALVLRPQVEVHLENHGERVSVTRLKKCLCRSRRCID